MKAITIAFATLLFAGHLIPVDAKESPAPSGDCITLSPSHTGTRTPGNEQLLLKDGDAHYRLGFAGQCGAVARSSVVEVETRGQRNLLCPEGSSVRAGNARCSVRSVERIDAADYERQARRNRR